MTDSEFSITNEGLDGESEEVTVGRDNGPYLLLDGEWRGSRADAIQVAFALLQAAGATQDDVAASVAALARG